jgi:hypothetical protein
MTTVSGKDGVFKDLCAPMGLLVNHLEKSQYKHGISMTELDDNIFDAFIDLISVKKTHNTTMKNRETTNKTKKSVKVKI